VRHGEFENPPPFEPSGKAEERDTRPRRWFGAGFGPSTATRSWLRSSAGTISARVPPGSAFESCCLRSGDFDGSERDDYSR
jgi:hypothetical protein